MSLEQGLELEIELPAEVAEPNVDQAAHVEIKRHIRDYVQQFADAWFATPLRIIVTGLVVMGCIGMIGWNLQRLSVLDELIELEIVEYDLRNQLNDIAVRMAGVDMDEISAQIRQENERVFQGFPELAAWAQSLAGIADSRGIEFSYQVERAHLSPVPDVLEVPIILEFKAKTEVADRLFEASMKLLGLILYDHWHIDVISTSAHGNGALLQSLSVRAQVWVRDRYGFVDISTLQSTAGASVADADADAGADADGSGIGGIGVQ